MFRFTQCSLLSTILCSIDTPDSDSTTVAEIQVGRGGGQPPPPPFVNRHSLSEILGSVGISKQLNVGN